MRSGDGEAGDVEVVQDEQRDVMIGAQLFDQRPRCRDRHALGRHDGEVEALGDAGRIEQRLEALLLDEQDRAEAILRAVGREAAAELDVRNSRPGVW